MSVCAHTLLWRYERSIYQRTAVSVRLMESLAHIARVKQCKVLGGGGASASVRIVVTQ